MVKGEPKTTGDYMEKCIELFLANRSMHPGVSEESVQVARTFFGQVEGTTINQMEVGSRVWLCMAIVSLISLEVPGMDKQFKQILGIVKIAGMLRDVMDKEGPKDHEV